VLKMRRRTAVIVLLGVAEVAFLTAVVASAFAGYTLAAVVFGVLMIVPVGLFRSVGRAD